MFFKKKESTNESDSFLEKTIKKFLLEGEVVENTFGIIDRVYVTNKRIIFKDMDIPISLKNDKKILELVFIDFDKLDGISYIETNNVLVNRIIKLKSRGFSHDMCFPKAGENDAIEFCNYLSQKLLDLKK